MELTPTCPLNYSCIINRRARPLNDIYSNISHKIDLAENGQMSQMWSSGTRVVCNFEQILAREAMLDDLFIFEYVHCITFSKLLWRLKGKPAGLMVICKCQSQTNMFKNGRLVWQQYEIKAKMTFDAIFKTRLRASINILIKHEWLWQLFKVH